MNCSSGLILCVIMLLCGLGCSSPVKRGEGSAVYFDLDQVLDEQIQSLTDQSKGVEKRVVSGDKAEELAVRMDATLWSEEFAVIRELNINQPHYQGVYQEMKTQHLLRFKRLDDGRSPITAFEVRFDQAGEVVEIQAASKEMKYVYDSERKIKLLFENGNLTYYKIWGFQKMRFLDEINYLVEGRIVSNESIKE